MADEDVKMDLSDSEGIILEHSSSIVSVGGEENEKVIPQNDQEDSSIACKDDSKQISSDNQDEKEMKINLLDSEDIILKDSSGMVEGEENEKTPNDQDDNSMVCNEDVKQLSSDNEDSECIILEDSNMAEVEENEKVSTQNDHDDNSMTENEANIKQLSWDDEDEKVEPKSPTETGNSDPGDETKAEVKTYGISHSRPVGRKNICCNENCQTTKLDPLVRAPTHALSFFCLQNPKHKVQRICQDCLDRANCFTEKCIDSLKSEIPVFTYKTEPRSVLTIHLDEDSDEESEDDLEMSEYVKVSNLESVLDNLTEKYKLMFQTDECTKILEKEMNDLENEFLQLDAQFTKAGELVEETRKLYLDITVPKIKPVVVGHVDIDASGEVRNYTNGDDYVPQKKRPVAVKHTSFPPKISQENQRSTRSSTSQASEDCNEVLEVNLVSRVAPQIQLSATPPVIPRVNPKVGDKIYGMLRTSLHYWLRGEITEIQPGQHEYVVKFEPTRRGRPVRDGNKYDGGTVQTVKAMGLRHLAYNLPCPFILPVGTRVIAKFKDEFQTELDGHGHFYAGIVAEPPKNTNLYRYLIFFDDGYAQYVSQDEVLLVCESSKDVWQDVHPDSSDFIKNYVSKYPERPMVRLQKGSMVTTELNGKWLVARVVELDCSLVKMHFEADSRYEWIYRGSTRLSPLFHKQERQLTSGTKSNTRRHNASTASRNTNQLTIEYMYGADDWKNKYDGKTPVARKSTGTGPARPEPQPMIGVLKRKGGPIAPSENRLIEFEGSVAQIQIPTHVPKPKDYEAHMCSEACVNPYNKDDKSLRTINPLALPIYMGWGREIAKAPRRTIFYRAPCGRRLRDYEELYRFLTRTNYGLGIDYFCYDFAVDCFHEFRPTRIIKQLKDLTYSKEQVKITCVNALDFDHPEYLEYSADRIPGKGVTINTDKEFLMCCDCTDDCRDKSKCACWQLTLSGISFTKLNNPDFPTKGYENRRLYDHIVSGIYECNSKCSCKKTCFNRVAQQPLKWHLQVFKTTLKGWGIRPLYDIPQGAFICIYAGQVLTEEGANEEGRTFGDEYLAELDFIEVNEQVKADYEDNVTDIEDDGRGNSDDESKSRVVTTTSSGRVVTSRRITDDYDSDEEGRKRKPSKFDAKPSSFAKKKKIERLPTRELFGKDEQCYIMDAKSMGNIGRYLNHSCQPNVFVQNVFVDTHDLRFPWVAFFAYKHIRAGTELTWDYNYDIGSVPDKSMYCYCGASDCRGRLL